VSTSEVTRQGLVGTRPAREAVTGAAPGDGNGSPGGRRSRRRGAEAPMVPDAEFRSYYGLPVLNQPVWKSQEIAGYLFLGGLAGTSSLLAAGAQLTGRTTLAKRTKVTALAGIALSTVALVKDLGRPSRFANMLRVFKPTSPMSVGSWLLAAYGPATGVAALSAVTGRRPVLGGVATGSAAVLGLGVSSYTAALLADTAVPAWHDAWRELPFAFVGAAATAGGGMALATGPLAEVAPARRLAVAGAAVDLAATLALERRLHPAVATAYRTGRARAYVRAGEALTAVGAVGAALGRRDRLATALSGVTLVAGSACARFGIFHAGLASAADPAATIRPQRERLTDTAPVNPSEG
jgi:formate-dependent nitrite reductase membrane component NrfD